MDARLDGERPLLDDVAAVHREAVAEILVDHPSRDQRRRGDRIAGHVDARAVPGEVADPRDRPRSCLLHLDAPFARVRHHGLCPQAKIFRTRAKIAALPPAGPTRTLR